MKIKIKVLITSVLLLTCVKFSQAQPYKWGIGAVVGSMDGVQGKLFFTPHLALQGDLACKFGVYPFGSGGNHISLSLYDFELNPNLLYQKNIAEWGFGQLDWFAGGGFSLGYAWNWGFGIGGGWSSTYSLNYGKFGINALGGVELSLSKIPLAIAMDFRPGYGLIFNKSGTGSFFDWALTAGVRYCFGKK